MASCTCQPRNVSCALLDSARRRFRKWRYLAGTFEALLWWLSLKYVLIFSKALIDEDLPVHFCHICCQGILKRSEAADRVPFAQCGPPAVGHEAIVAMFLCIRYRKPLVTWLTCSMASKRSGGVYTMWLVKGWIIHQRHVTKRLIFLHKWDILGFQLWEFRHGNSIA